MRSRSSSLLLGSAVLPELSPGDSGRHDVGGRNLWSISDCSALRNACSVSTTLVKPRLAQFDGAHEGAGPFRCAVGECEVGVLITLTDQLAQTQRPKSVLDDDVIPHIGMLG
jgi:hypothetical protein